MQARKPEIYRPSPTVVAVTLFGPAQKVVGHGVQNLMRRLPHQDGPNDIANWTVQGINFSEGFSFVGWNLQRVRFVECDISDADFTGADTRGMTLDCCTTTKTDGTPVKGLDLENLAENRMPNPHSLIAALPADVLPRRRQRSPRQPWGQKLT